MKETLRAARGATLIALGAAFLAMGWAFRFATDRACIDARYAQHLGQGLGARFNAADAPVEGWSSPLLTAAGGLAEAIGIPALPAMQVLGLFAGLLLGLSVYRELVGPLRVRAPVALGAVATLAVSPAVAAWATGRPETLPTALAAWVLFAELLHGRAPARAMAAAALLLLARQDGVFLAAGLTAIALAWRSAEWRRWTRPLPRLARPRLLDELWVPLSGAVVALGLAGALAGLRLWSFGDPVPWYLRQLGPADPVEGLWYIAGAAVGSGLPLVWLAGLWPARLRSAATPIAAAIALGLLAAIASGSESEPFARRLLPIAPFGTAALAMHVDRLVDRQRWGTAAALVGLAIALANLPAWEVPLAPRRVRQAVDLRPETARTRTELAQWRFTRQNTEEGLALGRAVRDLAGPEATWTAGSPGARGLGSDLHLYDLSGATDPRAYAARRGRRAPRKLFLPQEPTILRARAVQSAELAAVIAVDWSAANPDYATRIVETDGRWIAVQERTR